MKTIMLYAEIFENRANQMSKSSQEPWQIGTSYGLDRYKIRYRVLKTGPPYQEKNIDQN